MSTQTTLPISSRHCQIIFQIELAMFHPIKQQFNNAAPFYSDTLSGSGYKESLTYQQDLKRSKKITKRKVIWFNPPYSVNVERNIVKTFLKFINKQFPKTNKFHKIFNKSNAKVSYRCLANFDNMIKLHNNK